MKLTLEFELDPAALTAPAEVEAARILTVAAARLLRLRPDDTFPWTLRDLQGTKVGVCAREDD